jgi:hypothetical protein
MSKSNTLPAYAVKAALAGKRGALRCWLHRNKAEVMRMLRAGASARGIVRAFNELSPNGEITISSGCAIVAEFLKTQAAATGTAVGKNSKETRGNLVARVSRPGGNIHTTHAVSQSDVAANSAVPALAATPVGLVAEKPQAPESSEKETPQDAKPARRDGGFSSSLEADRAIMFGGLD